jgi:tetratricopeptide (TPR) repeat protein
MFIGPRFRRVTGKCSFRLRYLVPALVAGFFIVPVAPAQREPSGSEAQAHRGRPSPFADAESLLASGRIQEAKAKAEEELRAHPASVDGYNLLGIICSQSKDYACAEGAFDRALRLDPASTQTHNNRGNLLVGEGKPELAEKEFRKVLTIAPANRDANYNLGLLLLLRGAPDKAITYFLRVHPPDFETRFNLVRAYLRSGNTNAGLKGAATLSAENKGNVALHFTLGTILAAERQYKPAELEFERANALQPETFEILYNLGEVYLRGKQYSQAELVLNRALKLKADSAETLYLLAQVYFDESRPVDALDLLVRAHKIAPDNTDVIFLMARVSMNQNFYEDAIPLLESGLKITPQRADLHAALGESYFMSGKTEKAIEEFQKLIQLDPSARSYVFMGLSYRHLGRFDDARRYFQDGLKRDPHNASCLFNLGFIEEHQGNVVRADELFQQALRANPDFSDALLEMANLRMKDKKFAEAADLLRHYVKVSRDPASGYYKLAMAERSMHQMAAAQRDLSVFQTLSKDSSTGPYPFQHLFDYLDSRSKLSSRERNQLDISELTEQMKKHPGQPQDFYLLAESYLKMGKKDEALETVTKLDAISADDYRTQTGVGVLLARYHLYDDAIRHFQTALHANPDSDDVKYDLAAAYFRKGLYPEALDSAQKVSAAGQKDDAYLALLGDIYAHVGDTAKSLEIFSSAIDRNPDNDQYYLSLALAQLRAEDLNGAEQALKRGLSRIPASGKLLWGLGLVSVLQGNAAQAAARLERAVELLPEWAGSYSTLGVFYYETGQIDKAREVLNRFKGSNAAGLDVNRIEAALSQAPAQPPAAGPIPMVARQQLLQLALSIADRTL